MTRSHLIGMSFIGLMPAFLGCASGHDDQIEAIAAEVAASPPGVVTLPTLFPPPVATLQSGGHTFQFFVPSKGPRTIAENVPIGSAPILSEQTVGSMSASRIYQMLSGGSTVPSTITAAEANATAATNTGTLSSSVPAFSTPVPIQSSTASGPRYYTESQQTWFADTYCVFGAECIQGYDYADATMFLAAGRGYETVAMNGSEASTSRELMLYWWDGSEWEGVLGEPVPPGTYYYIYTGNPGSPTFDDNKYYWYSTLEDDGVDESLVSLADYTWPWVQVCQDEDWCLEKDEGCPPTLVCDHVWPESGCTGYPYVCYWPGT